MPCGVYLQMVSAVGLNLLLLLLRAARVDDVGGRHVFDCYSAEFLVTTQHCH